MTDPTLATYEFVSLVRRGASADLTNADPLSGALPYRGPIQVQLTVESSDASGAKATDTRSSSVLTYGPGDVVGIDPRHVIRTDPPHLTTDFEPNYLASIEFEHPDFPWLFTPASSDSGGRLRPWLALIVLGEDELETLPATTPLPQIKVKDAKTLPKLEESWAWAHAQVSGGTDDLAATLRTEPGRVISRLICPRRLRPRTRYRAFVVPAFATGVLAGTGAAVPTAATTQTEPAWKGTDANKVLPFFYQFEFATSERGDFESLARQLVPRALPGSVGIRPMSIPAQPAWNVPAAGADLGLSGALRSVSTIETAWTGASRTAFRNALAQAANRGAGRVSDTTDDPRIAPPLYARWHAAVTSVSPSGVGWLTDLNLDPRTRAMAGTGTQVVRRQRGQLLTAAWKQLGAILEANQKLRAAQAARAAMQKVHTKHLQAAGADALLAMTSLVHARLLASPRTIAATIASSRLPARALSPAFRRVVRPLGPIRRRQRVDRARDPRWITRLNSGELRVVPPPRPPGGLVTIEDIADGFLPPWAPAWLRPLLPHLSLILVGLALLFALASLVAAALGAPTLAFLLAVIAVVLLVLAFRIRPYLARWRLGTGARLDRFTPDAFESQPPRPNFRLVALDEPLAPADSPVAGGTDSPDAAALRKASIDLARALGRARDDPPDPPGVDVPKLQTSVLEGVDPATTIPARLDAVVSVEATLHWTPEDELEPIMAAPVIDTPMYEPLRDLSQDLLLPGVKEVPANTISLLEENHRFIEAYLVGANVEFGRELLYADFPTDQRLSSFRQFWDVRGYVPKTTDPTDPDALRERLRDIPPIHTWAASGTLGANRNRQELVPGNLVLLVRGQLLQRYPNAVIYASEARWDATTAKRVLGTTEKHPLFRGTLAPDITFFGFELTPEQARGSTDRTKPQGWWFVFQQNASEPRFGLDAAPEPYAVPTVTAWTGLSWANFAKTASDFEKLEFVSVLQVPDQVTIVAGNDNPNDLKNRWYDGTTKTDSAQIAYITLRRPARVAIHAEMMLPPSGGS